MGSTGGARVVGGAPRPKDRRQIAASWAGSTSSRSLTAASAKPRTTRAGTPLAAATDRRLATIVPPSQKAWRYARAWYFHALRQNVLVHTIVTGDWATLGSSPAAALSTPRKSPRRSRRSALSCAP